MHERSTRRGTAVIAATSALTFLLQCAPALADDDAAAAPPPADPAVARISVTRGGVDVQRADSGDTFAAAVNAPLSVGDDVTTKDESYGEIELDYGTSIRLAPDTEMRFTQLAFDRHQLQLAQGTIDLRVFRGLAAHPEVQTPAATIVPDGNGSARITVTSDGNTEVTARVGSVDVQTSAGTQTLQPGPTLLVTGNADNAQVQTIDPVAYDAFDTFNRHRDALVERANDWAYVDAGMVGAEDLDRYGRWTDVAGYGQVWQPTNEPDGWAPYHTGRWVWEPYYGWSWVDTAPWGYAPYHYGRWFYADASWYWAPGITVAGPAGYAAPVVFVPHPVYYRPALVAFFSFGGGGGIGAGFGAGFGNVGWCPLAPSEPFHPWYGPAYGGYVTYNRTTITNVTTVTNVTNVYTYRNASAPGGAVAVNNGNFASGNFTHLVPVRASDLANVAPIRGVVPVVPTRSNLAFTSHALAPVETARPSGERFARFAAAPKVVAPPFAEQQKVVQSAAGRTYPEHAALFAHPEVQKSLARPGLITSDDAPATLKPRATTPGAATQPVTTRVAPDGVAPERVAPERVAPERVAPERVAPERVAPDETAKPAPARSIDPFERFEKPATAPQAPAATENRPSYAAPDATSPVHPDGYRTPEPGTPRTTTAKPGRHARPKPAKTPADRKE